MSNIFYTENICSNSEWCIYRGRSITGNCTFSVYDFSVLIYKKNGKQSWFGEFSLLFVVLMDVECGCGEV